MTEQAVTNCLLILLDNEVTTLFPFLERDEVYRVSSWKPVQIPTTIMLSSDEMTIGNVPNSNGPATGWEFVCHFVRAFEGSYNKEDIEELKLVCPGIVSYDSEGVVGYMLSSMDKQVLSPLQLIRLFLKCSIQYEEQELGWKMQRVYIVYPPSFSPSHVNYLKYMLRSIGDYDFITQNRMLLQIASFCPVPDASSIPMILFDACYDALHIFVCELSLTRVKVLQHVWSVSLGRHCIVVRLMNSIVDQYHRKLNSALPETVLDQVYDCCNNVLDRLAIQSSCSLSVRCTGGSFSTAVHRSEVIQLLGEAIDLFKSDFESVLRAAALPAEAIRAAVLSGTCYDVPGYEETVRAVLPTAPLVRSNDVGEMMMHGLDGGLALEVAEVEETEMHVLQAQEPQTGLSTQALQLMKEEIKQLRARHKKQAGQSSQSGQSSQVSQSGQSSQVGQPSQSSQSNQVSQVSQSGQSGQVGQPSQSGQVGQSSQSSQVGQSSQSSQSSQSDQSSQSGQAAMTIPVSLQLAGDEIFAPTNPTVHCGRGGGASRVDISTRLRSGVGGLEAEEKTEGRTRRRAAQAEKEKEKEKEAKPRALTGKEIVDLAMQARLNWRDLKRLAALVERSKKSEGEEVKEKKSGVEEKKSGVEKVKKAEEEQKEVEQKDTKKAKEVKPAEETKEVKEVKDTKEAKDTRPRRGRQRDSVSLENVVFDATRKASIKALHETRKQLQVTHRHRLAADTKAVKRAEPSGETPQGTETPEKAVKLEKPAKPAKSAKPVKLAKPAKPAKPEKSEKSEKPPGEKGKRVKKETFQLPKIPPCLFDFETRFAPLPAMYITPLPTTLPKPVPAAQRAWEDDLSAAMYYSPALHDPVTQKADDLTRPHRYADGSVYTGHTVGSLRHGTGRLVYPDGSVYKGQFRENNRFGKGVLRSRKGVLFFDGTFEYDYPKKGVLTLTNGARYEGQFSRGLPDGEGTLYGNGRDATWDGEWQAGVVSGKGTYFFDSGDYYDGAMAANRRNGEGRICTKRGVVLFDGAWKDDLQEGPGVQVFPDGCFLRLSFHAGVPTGEVTVLDREEKVLGSGRFEDGVYTGYGRYYMKEGTRYFGEVSRNKMEGRGDYYFDENWHLKSAFSDNMCDGAFELYWQDTLRMKGVIKRRILCGEGTEYYPDGKVLYEGNYAKNVRDGKGRLNFPDGSYYIGNFTSGFISGRGTFYSPKGEVVFSGSFLRNRVHPRA